MEVYKPTPLPNGTPITSNALAVNNSGQVIVKGTNSSGFDFYVNGQGGALNGFVTGSDLRLKKNIERLNNVNEKIKNINGVKFDWRVSEFPDRNLPKTRQIGMIAQEVEKEFPELVITDSNGYKSLAYDRFTAILLEAVKEQQNEIDALKGQQKEIDILKQEVSALKSKSAKN